MPDALPIHNQDQESTVEKRVDEPQVLKILQTYKTEAESARKSGPSPRDTIWDANWDRYWGRVDFSKKAGWQAKFVMPEVPQFVDRWAAAMREALTQPGRWWEADDPADQNQDLVPHINKLMEVLLARAGRTADGHQTDFSAIFEDQMKLAALMCMCVSITWKEGVHGGWVAVESVDPRQVWVDPKGRNLYRIRRDEIDKHELLELARAEDSSGKPLYDVAQIKELAASVDDEHSQNREQATGSGTDRSSGTSIIIDEYLATVITEGPDGEVVARNSLIIVANDKFIIRGPEENPFWHKKDWLVLTPMVSVPFSAYGRSYLEDWADPADAFIEMTNLILDAAHTSALKVFATVPGKLEDPTQLNEGISPNKNFMLEDVTDDAKTFMSAIDMGTLPTEAIKVWTALKQEMRDGAKLSEIALGQVPPKGDITATEISEVQQSSSAMIRSMARTIEAKFLEPVLTRMFQTALQHMDFTDPQIVLELGEETAFMLQARKQEFRQRSIKFRVRGLSALVDRQEKLRNLLSLLQIIGQNEQLLATFLQRTDINKLLNELFRLFGLDPESLEQSEREQRIRGIVDQSKQLQDQTNVQTSTQTSRIPSL